MMILTIIFLILSAEYFIVFVIGGISWIYRKSSYYTAEKEESTVSIIIAARNEETNIEDCIKSILNQSYKNYYLIIADDHSDDKTAEIVQDFAEKYPNIQLIKLPEGVYGKKNALRYAVSKSSADFLFFTDADCILNEYHLERMMNYRNANEVDMLCGPVEFNTGRGLFSLLFQLEFLSLTGSGAAGLFLGKAFICNGANYLIKKDLFLNAADKMNDKYSSGDDVFLLQHLAKTHKLDFIKDRNCIVKTNAPEDISDFFAQRLRWASKSKAYRSFTSVYIAILVFIASLIILASPVILFSGFENALLYFLIIIGLKFIAELFFILPVLNFHKKQNLLLYVPILFILHPIYIFSVTVISLFHRPLWKGKRIVA